MSDHGRTDNATLAADIVDRATLERLSDVRGAHLVSIYLPTNRAGPDTRENPIRMKNRLAQAQRQLEARGWERNDAEAYLEPARRLVDDHGFWQHQLDGLAVFVGPDGLQTWRLPRSVEELTLVADALHLKPLLPLVTGDGVFYALRVSLNEARLYQGSRYEVAEVDLGDTPTSLAEALRFDEFEQYRGQQGVSRGGAGGTTVAFGTDDLDERRKRDILRFFQALDNGVRERIGSRHVPLVFAGVDFLYPLYREANHHDALLGEHVSGNPDAWDEAELHARTWEIAASRFEQARDDDVERLHQLAGTGRATADLGEALLAAHDGRVDTLFVALGRHRWGRFDPERRSFETHPELRAGSRDLLDIAGLEALRTGGTVYAVPGEELPAVRLQSPDGAGPPAGKGSGSGADSRGSGVAALFRY